MDDDRLSVESAYAMRHYATVGRAVEAVVRRATVEVERQWGPKSDGGGSTGLGFWQHFEWQHEEPRIQYMEFMVTPDDRTADPTGGYSFFAGLTFKKRNDPFPSRADANLLSSEFEVWSDPGWGRRMKSLRPEVLLQSDNPDEQAKILADWVVGAFRSMDGAFSRQ